MNLCLSSANETTQDTCLSFCTTGTYVPATAHWHFASSEAIPFDKLAWLPSFYEPLEQAMRKHGAPKHIISDQDSVFVGDVFAELLQQWNIKPRFGAVGIPTREL